MRPYENHKIDFLVVRFKDYEVKIPELCSTMGRLYATWISPSYYMSLAAIMYRYKHLIYQVFNSSILRLTFSFLVNGWLEKLEATSNDKSNIAY